MAGEPVRGRITRPPPVVLLGLIGYVTASAVGLSAIGVAFCLYEASAGRPEYLLFAAAFGLSMLVWSAINRRLVAWWVRRQPPEPPRH